MLVVGAGGTLGEAWARGVLTGATAASGIDFRACACLLGTSAGSIVVAALAGGRAPAAGDRGARELGDAAAEVHDTGERRLPRPLLGALRAGRAVTAPVAPLALAASAPGGAAARALALRRAPRPARTLAELGDAVDELGARFDGRLRIAAVDRRSGRRVIFGAPDAPGASVRDAVLASCAVPWLFAPVEIRGREYVDGGVWSPTNLDAVPARRGDEVLCLVPTALPGSRRSAYHALRSLTRAGVAAETLALQARGARVQVVAPDRASAAAMGEELMDASRAEAVLDAAVAQGHRWARAARATA